MADSALWRVVAPGGTAAIEYRVTLPNDWQRRAGWKPFLAPTVPLIGGLHTLMYMVDATLIPGPRHPRAAGGKWDISAGKDRVGADPRRLPAAHQGGLDELPRRELRLDF